MLTKQQENKYIQMIPADTTGEDRRAAYSVVTGYREDKTPEQISAYYSVSIDFVNKWYSFFDFKKNTSTNKRGRRGGKKNVLNSFVKENIGKTVTPKEIADELEISLPTFYNFYNANRHFFKKIKRGQFEIVDADAERGVK